MIKQTNFKILNRYLSFIYIIFTVPVMYGQLNVPNVGDSNISACLAKYFPPIITLDKNESMVRCAKSDPHLCDVAFGIRQGNYNGVRCLIDAGYDFNVANATYKKDLIPVMQAVFDHEMLEIILYGKIPLNVDVTDTSGSTALLSANWLSVLSGGYIHKRGFTSNEAYQSIELLLKKGANPNVTREGITPLILQAESGQARFVELLLRYGANPDLQSLEGETALMRSSDDPEKIKMLLTANLNIFLKDRKGESAIFHAIENCQVNKIAAILKKDREVLNSVNNKGTTALNYLKKQSSSTRCPKLAEFLSSE